LDFSYDSSFSDSEIAKIDPGEENNRAYPMFGLFIDGELVSTAILIGHRRTAGTLSFSYPWQEVITLCNRIYCKGFLIGV
jgi:hypothetical protein